MIHLLHRRIAPLPELRSTSDILSDVDIQIGRLSRLRDTALELVEKLEKGYGDDDEASG